MRSLVVVESLFVTAFVGIAGFALFDRAPVLPPIDAAALSVGPADERWMGIFIGDQHVGYAVSRDAPAADGGRVYEEQSAFALQAMGNVQTVALASTALTGPDGALRAFDFVLSSPMTIYAHGEMTGLHLDVDVTQGGDQRRLSFDLAEAPVMGMTLASQVRGRPLQSGQTFDLPYFDPLTLTNSRAQVRVEAPEILPNGESAWWLSTRVGGIETRRLVDTAGNTLREEEPGGIRTQAMTRAEAIAVDAGPPPDLVSRAAVPIVGTVDESHPLQIVRLRVSGVEAARFAQDPPLQSVAGDEVTVSVPLLAELSHAPIVGEGDLESTVTIPATDPEIITRARAVVGDAPDRLEAARRLYQFVHDYVQKVPTMGVPNGLVVLHEGRGDCNEHTVLYVSLARAVGIPSRISAGLVYSSQTGDAPAFFYHAWPEVRIGPLVPESDAPGAPLVPGWVPVDPTLGQFPADATHLKIVNGDLDRQVEIISMLGKVRLEMVEQR